MNSPRGSEVLTRICGGVDATWMIERQKNLAGGRKYQVAEAPALPTTKPRIIPKSQRRRRALRMVMLSGAPLPSRRCMRSEVEPLRPSGGAARGGTWRFRNAFAELPAADSSVDQDCG